MKWLILGLREEIYKVGLELLITSEGKEGLKENTGMVELKDI